MERAAGFTLLHMEFSGELQLQGLPEQQLAQPTWRDLWGLILAKIIQIFISFRVSGATGEQLLVPGPSHHLQHKIHGVHVCV